MAKKTQMKRRNMAILARYAVVIAAMLVISGMIVSHLIDTTIIYAEDWNKKANKELSKVEVIQPERGDILAADGSVLATNMRYYTVRIDYTSGPFKEQKFRAQMDTITDSLAYYFPVRNKEQWRELLEGPLSIADKEKRPRNLKILENISYTDYLKFRTMPFFNQPNKLRCGVFLEKKDRRINPYGTMASRSIGTVGETKEDPRRLGRSGLEAALDPLLFGEEGLYKKIPMTKGIKNWTDKPAVPGYDITTTIDIQLQELVENELNRGLEFCQAEWGTAILMEVSTGDIKAIANLERDPSGNYVQARNRAVERFEPGSVMKTISMLIALEDGLVHDLDSVIPTGKAWPYQIAKKPIQDDHPKDAVPVRRVLELSSNIGISKIITKRFERNPGEFYTRLGKLGLHERLNTGIKEEQLPRIDSLPANKAGRISLSRMSYGYTLELPPLYSLAIYNAIANDGVYMRPRLVSRVSGEGFDSVIPPSHFKEGICSPRNAQILREMLTMVVESPEGTGNSLKSDYIKLAGKTGTCHIIEYDSVQKRTFYNKGVKRLAFCGFFPADAPRYSCIVLVAHPTQNVFGAAGTSGNIFRSIAHKLYARGLLGKYPDYHEESNEGTYPTFFASISPERNNQIRSLFNINGKRAAIASPRPVAAGVPNVVGYGLRDAVAILENAGYNVSIEGSGFVYSQYPAAGSPEPQGAKISLTLKP